MGSQVPSPTHASKSHRGGEVPTFEPQETMIKIRFIFMKSNLDKFMQKRSSGLVLRVGFSVLLDPSPEPHVQKVMPCRHPCHTWDPCEVVSLNFHALNR